MATKTVTDSCGDSNDNSNVAIAFERSLSLNSNRTNNLCVQYPPSKYFILFQNGSSKNENKFYFRPYNGTRARYHHLRKLYVPQMKSNPSLSPEEMHEEFSNCIEEVLHSIPYEDLSSHVVSIRMGVLYFYSKRFRFNGEYTMKEIRDLLEKKISFDDNYYYYPSTNNSIRSEDYLRSSFCNVKPINQHHRFVEELKSYEFIIEQHKHVFRVYLQSDDKQTHICTVDPGSNYSIVEFSKDFQRTCNIDFVRDRSSSKFKHSHTYDDIFDFRIQFQHNHGSRSDQMNTIEYELRQQFPSLSSDFRNEKILQPIDNENNDNQKFVICKELCPYVQYIRRDFGDVYIHEGDDEIFENFNIFLESSDEYSINRHESTCHRQLETHGIVYARLDLNTMDLSNSLGVELLISKLWNVAGGLTSMVGKCTTPETQQATNYYTNDGNTFTAQDEAIVQHILQNGSLHRMLNLRPGNIDDYQIKRSFDRIARKLSSKWDYIPKGPMARDKLNLAYEQYFNRAN